MFNKESDYALNKKNQDAIIYKDAQGEETILTRKDFSSEEEFRRWKDLSDEDYHAIEKSDHRHFNHTQALYDLSDAAATVPAIDEEIELRIDRQFKLHLTRRVILQIKGYLTDRQFRRLWRYYALKIKVVAIAADEHVTHQAITKSLVAARKKIFRRMQKQVAKSPQKRR